jgi:3-hydroxyacyl-[acyl-carrier-protein] dehydratase
LSWLANTHHVSPNHDPATLDDPELREMLKRCSPATYFAACKFRQSRDPADLAIIINGVVERYVERDLRARLLANDTTLRLREDLGLDSLTMMEIVMLAEEVLHISISNEELTHLRTLGDVHRFFEEKTREPAPQSAATPSFSVAAGMPNSRTPAPAAPGACRYPATT